MTIIIPITTSTFSKVMVIILNGVFSYIVIDAILNSPSGVWIVSFTMFAMVDIFILMIYLIERQYSGKPPLWKFKENKK